MKQSSRINQAAGVSQADQVTNTSNTAVENEENIQSSFHTISSPDADAFDDDHLLQIFREFLLDLKSGLAEGDRIKMGLDCFYEKDGLYKVLLLLLGRRRPSLEKDEGTRRKEMLLPRRG